jgi:hypothetical protein
LCSYRFHIALHPGGDWEKTGPLCDAVLFCTVGGLNGIGGSAIRALQRNDNQGVHRPGEAHPGPGFPGVALCLWCWLSRGTASHEKREHQRCGATQRQRDVPASRPTKSVAVRGVASQTDLGMCRCGVARKALLAGSVALRPPSLRPASQASSVRPIRRPSCGDRRGSRSSGCSPARPGDSRGPRRDCGSGTIRTRPRAGRRA